MRTFEMTSKTCDVFNITAAVYGSTCKETPYKYKDGWVKHPCFNIVATRSFYKSIHDGYTKKKFLGLIPYKVKKWKQVLAFKEEFDLEVGFEGGQHTLSGYTDSGPLAEMTEWGTEPYFYIEYGNERYNFPHIIPDKLLGLTSMGDFTKKMQMHFCGRTSDD